MAKIEQKFIDDILSRVDLPRFIGQYVPDLKKAGASYSACCPFHEEKTGSFKVVPSKGIYHCFGCGVNGNAIKFVMEKSGKSFPEAVEEVAAFVGMTVPKEAKQPRTEEQKKEAQRVARAYDALAYANGVYQKQLDECAEAQIYLLERGVTDDSVKKFSIGYAPDGWNTITGSKSMSAPALDDAGLSNKSEKGRTYDRFRDRITFPIYGRKDALIGFGARAIHEQEPKYLNSPETILFKKGDNLYGLKQAAESISKEGRVFVVEGYMDVVMVSQHGVENVVSSLGTSVTDEQMRKMFILCQHITFCFDGDRPGRDAAWRAAINVLPLIDEKHKVDFMFMPDDIDPDDFVRANGRTAFNDLAANARTLTEFILDVVLSNTDMNNGESLAQYLSETSSMADKIQNAVIKLSFQKRVAESAGISLDTMLKMLKEQRDKLSPHQTVVVPDDPKPAPNAAFPVELSVAAKLLGVAILKNRALALSLDCEYLSRFLSRPDKDMLLPMIAYIKSNQSSTDEALMATFAYNPHAKLITSLLHSTKLLKENYDAEAELAHVLNGFQRIEHIWNVVKAAKPA